MRTTGNNMSWIRRKTYPFLQPLFASALALTITGCANTGFFSSQGRTASDAKNDVPNYVRNLPKSRTGNMAEYTVFGKSYTVLETAAGFSEEGIASWYGKKFHGRKTSSGEVYDMHAMTAAHKHLPLPTYARVTNLENNRSIVVKVNDRGPFVGARVIDLSFAAAQELDMAEQGTANVEIVALSTHLVAENEDSSNRSVVQSFGQKPADRNSTMPAVVEPTLAAVPLQNSSDVIAQFETEVVPTAKGELTQSTDSAINLDSNDDGFVELAATTENALTDTPGVEQPFDVQILADGNQLDVLPEANNPAAETVGKYFIQLGAFGHAPNADALVVDVGEKTGMTAFVEKDSNQDLYRVKMGPFEKGLKLDTTMTELASIGIDGYTKQAIAR